MLKNEWFWSPTKAPPTRPGSYTMPFGRYKGRTLAWIDRSHRDYLLWCVDRLKAGAVTEAIKRFLAERPR